MFANCQMGGNNFACPDVCLTPAGPSVVPIPYPNTAQGVMAIPPTGAMTVLISGMPGHNLRTMVPMSMGDTSGVVGGVISHLIMGPRRHNMGAFTVLIGGAPATKLTSMTGQNGMAANAVGSTLAPAQTRVMIMK